MRLRVRRRRYSRSIGALRGALMLLGLAALGYCGYVYLDTELYQKYENWAFDEELHGRAPSVPAFLADSTPLRKVLRKAAVSEEKDDVAPSPGHDDTAGTGGEKASQQRKVSPSNLAKEAVERSLIGRIEIPRLKIRAIVREGDDDRTLRRAVGHIPSTALPGAPGNIGLAGHRDTFFRSLRHVRKNDHIAIRTLDGDYNYSVDSISIVGPKDVRVLNPTEDNILTIVTCYPFNYVGNAPKRFIVRAKQVGVETKASKPETETNGDADAAAGASQ